jgi:hypothetical protein
MTLIIIIVWLVCCAAVASRAKVRGRSGVGWFFFSLFFSPLIGIILIFVLPEKPTEPDEATLLLTRKCPYCFSVIPSAASVCSHCARESAPTMTLEQFETLKRRAALGLGAPPKVLTQAPFDRELELRAALRGEVK